MKKPILVFLAVVLILSCSPGADILGSSTRESFFAPATLTGLGLKSSDHYVEKIPWASTVDVAVKKVLIPINLRNQNFFSCEGGFVLEMLNKPGVPEAVNLTMTKIVHDNPDTEEIENISHSENLVSTVTYSLTPGYDRKVVWLRNGPGTYRVAYSGYVWTVFNRASTLGELLPSYWVDFDNPYLSEAFQKRAAESAGKESLEKVRELWAEIRGDDGFWYTVHHSPETASAAMVGPKYRVNGQEIGDIALDGRATALVMAAYGRFFGIPSRVVSSGPSVFWCEYYVQKDQLTGFFDTSPLAEDNEEPGLWLATDPSPRDQNSVDAPVEFLFVAGGAYTGTPNSQY